MAVLWVFPFTIKMLFSLTHVSRMFSDRQVSVTKSSVFCPFTHFLPFKGLILYNFPCNSMEISTLSYSVCTACLITNLHCGLKKPQGISFRAWDFYLEKGF